MVIELADPATRHSRASPFRDRIAAARRMFAEVQARAAARTPRDLEGRTVRVAGVGFYDVYHFQRGRSRSCIELHPVLSIEN